MLLNRRKKYKINVILIRVKAFTDLHCTYKVDEKISFGNISLFLTIVIFTWQMFGRCSDVVRSLNQNVQILS